jgi:hypothetical protein
MLLTVAQVGNAISGCRAAGGLASRTGLPPRGILIVRGFEPPGVPSIAPRPRVELDLRQVREIVFDQLVGPDGLFAVDRALGRTTRFSHCSPIAGAGTLPRVPTSRISRGRGTRSRCRRRICPTRRATCTRTPTRPSRQRPVDAIAWRPQEQHAIIGRQLTHRPRLRSPHRSRPDSGSLPSGPCRPRSTS